MASEVKQEEPWFLKSKHPVLMPFHPALTLQHDDFEAFLQEDIKLKPEDAEESATETDESFSLVSTAQSTTAEVREATKALSFENTSHVDPTESLESTATAVGIDMDDAPTYPLATEGLPSKVIDEEMLEDNEKRMLTENADVAYRSTSEPVLDLFFELEDVISGPRLMELLNSAWNSDPLMTLKVLFNARSIHLGKASRQTFYRCCGWLAQTHPLTLISNLAWLSRPVIQKNVVKKTGDEEDAVLVDATEVEKDETDITRFDVKNGVAHGYWKDLLNILALSVNGKLNVLANPRDILNVEREGEPRSMARVHGWPPQKKQKNQKNREDPADVKVRQRNQREARHNEAVGAVENDPVHRALHFTVARLFAEQLKSDLQLLHGTDSKAKSRISLCGKWAPSLERFHDKHTFIASSIAELLHPITEMAAGESMDRELYLRHARDLYRQDLTALRTHLDIVERHLSDKTYGKIKYNRVPSIAMNNDAPIFAAKDGERFEKYLLGVFEGKCSISGATLLPSTLIKSLRQGTGLTKPAKSMPTGMQGKMKSISDMVIDGQWKTLVQRIKDSGTLESSIAVCDVSGSMSGPVFPDGTTPMDSAIGLSLLLAEVTAPPFGGKFITFSVCPELQTIDLTDSLQGKYNALSRSHWTMNTNFVAVFENLILPMAIVNNLKPEEMVKRIFVFSDMQFDAAQPTNYYGSRGREEDTPEDWNTSFDRIKEKFAESGYEVPELVFWNMAGGRAGYYGGETDGDPVAPKPVTSEDYGTAMVSGYSQGMLKVFLDNGSFEDAEEDEEIVEEVQQNPDEDEDEAVVVTKKRKIDPMSTLRKAIGHKAYEMLKVLD